MKESIVLTCRKAMEGQHGYELDMNKIDKLWMANFLLELGECKIITVQMEIGIGKFQEMTAIDMHQIGMTDFIGLG